MINWSYNWQLEISIQPTFTSENIANYTEYEKETTFSFIQQHLFTFCQHNFIRVYLNVKAFVLLSQSGNDCSRFCFNYQRSSVVSFFVGFQITKVYISCTQFSIFSPIIRIYYFSKIFLKGRNIYENIIRLKR